MIRKSYAIPIRDGQECLFFGLGDIHFDTVECDRDRLKRLIQWVQRRTRAGAMVRIVGLGDYADFASPSERRKTGREEFHESTYRSLDLHHLRALRELVQMLRPIHHCFLGLLTGHHHYRWVTRRALGAEWQGRSSDEWLARQLGCDYLGDGASLFRLRFPHAQHLDVLALHGSGSARTAGGRLQKRIHFSEIVPTAHIVMSGHDNSKLAYPRSGLDFDLGMIKRYVVGTGSFQRAYLEGEIESGYAERGGLVPADLGVAIFSIQMQQRNGRWRVDYHCSV